MSTQTSADELFWAVSDASLICYFGAQALYGDGISEEGLKKVRQQQ